MKKVFLLAISAIMFLFLTSCDCEHEFDNWVITKEATCTEEGVKTYKCSICGETKAEAIPCIPHNFNEGSVTKEATCSEEGIKTYKCTVCGYEKTENISCVSHKFDEGSITKEATCSEEGIKSYKCVVCGDEKTEAIPCIPHEYEETIVSEPTFDNDGKATYTCKTCGDAYDEDIPKKIRTVKVTVTNKKSIPKDIYNGKYSDRVELTFSLENQSDKPVKGVEGILYIKDLFGKEIMSSNCDFTGQTIQPDSTATFSGLGIDINQFIDAHVKLYNEDFTDLKFSYKIIKIVYEGESEEVKPTQPDVPVVVKVVNKKNIPEDIYNGRYSPRVQLTIEVTNNSDKDIKGVSGVLRIKDLFGKDILASTCDFTGQIIKVGRTATYSDLGMDINEFMDDHVKFYNEDYSDLIFEYTVDTIVYNNGESEYFN